MDKKLLLDRDIENLPSPDDAKFFGEVCKDIIEDSNGYHFEKSAWIENGKLKSYHSIDEFFYERHRISQLFYLQIFNSCWRRVSWKKIRLRNRIGASQKRTGSH